jgi:hypothetical protein
VADEIKSKLVIRAIERHDLLANKYKITSAPCGPEDLNDGEPSKLTVDEMAWDVGGWESNYEP